jgi:uncharacterized protein (TIGR02646 family)
MTRPLPPGLSTGALQRGFEVRSVNKGSHPSDAQGQPQTFASYQDAFEPLHGRLGRYCSYCERFQPSSLAVEHKQPKSHFPHLERDWLNLLLACANCNSSKRDGVATDAQPLWPDEGDSLSAIEYLPSGRVRPRQALTGEMAGRAWALLRLTGLDKSPSQASDRDFRWQDRLEAWSQATQAHLDLAMADTPALRRTIVRVAVNKGFFSVWYAVFAGDAAMRAALVEAFPGTLIHPAPLADR